MIKSNVMKHALMIGGGIQEVEAVHQLKEEGWRVGITDRNPNCPCRGLADYLIIADGRDPELIIESLLIDREKNGLPKVLFTLTELTTTVAIVSNVLGLPSPSIKGVAVSQSKAASKLTWQKNKVPTPAGYVLSKDEDASRVLAEIEYSCVVKPDISFGGQGVSLVNRAEDMTNALELAFRTSKSDKCVVEKNIRGTLHDGNGFFSSDGKFHLLSISDRIRSNKISVEGGATCPSSLSTKQQHEFSCLFERACRTLGIKYGPVKIDAIFDGEKFFVLEIAARLHGPRNSLLLIPNSYGKYLLPSVIESMVEKQPPQWNFEDQKYISCYEQIVVSQEGKISNIEGIKDIRKMNNVVYIQLFKNKGDKIIIPKNSTEVVGYIFVVGDNVKESQQKIKNAKNALKFSIEN